MLHIIYCFKLFETLKLVKIKLNDNTTVIINGHSSGIYKIKVQ